MPLQDEAHGLLREKIEITAGRAPTSPAEQPSVQDSGQRQDHVLSDDSARLQGYMPALDGLRGIAILLVMVLHFTFIRPTTGVEHLYSGIIGAGWAGVDLFFVLSGFLITGILYDSRHGENYFRTFYWRRAVRIFPLYYAFLFMLFVVLPWLKPGASLSMNGTDPQIWAWTYLNNVLMAREGWEGVSAHTTHLWSLAVEEQFYLVWPLVVWYASTRNSLLRISAVLIAAAWLIRLDLFYSAGNGLGGYLLFPARMDALVLGGVLAVLARDPDGMVRLRGLIAPALLLGAAALFATVAWSVRTLAPGTYLPAMALHVQLLGYPAVALVSGAALLAALDSRGYPRLNRILCSTVLIRFGKYSYGLYILHLLLRDLVGDRFLSAGVPVVLGSQIPSAVLIAVLSIGVSYGLAWVSWHAYEKHFIALKRFLPYGETGGEVTPRKRAPEIDRRVAPNH